MLRLRPLWFIGGSAVVCCIGAGVFAQAPSSPAFEVASVKVNTSGENRALFGNAPGGRFNATNVPLRSLIAAAYGSPQPLPNFRIIGGPSWIDSDRFDIVAKAADNSQPGAPDNVFMMLRTLLIDRFKLVAHRETRELTLYELVLARSDKKLGPQLRPTVVDCVPARRGGPLPAPQPNGRPTCGMLGGAGRIAGGGADIDQLAAQLSRLLNSTVLDKTGLSGQYDVDLTFTPELLSAGGPPPPGVDPNGPSVFTALQEQLGLKLQSGRGPVDVLVIDHVEHPTEN